MLWSGFADFVTSTDTSVGRTDQQRRDIAIYGVASEIGSLLAVVKKAILAAEETEGAMAARRRQQVGEEIGDVLWYVVCLSRLTTSEPARNVFQDDIRNLQVELSATDQRAARIEGVLTPEVKETFLARAAEFLGRGDFELNDYQQLAFLTARTKGVEFKRVCLAVLSQLSAEVLRTTLPPVELELNTKLADRELTIVLGEVVWHLAAVATVSGLSFNGIAAANRAKVAGRYKRSAATPLPDEAYPGHERFARKMQVSFVSVSKGRSQMFLEGRPLGNELTDNAKDNDGYRFHDVMHLAFLAKLGWSPVLRKLMGRKRKSRPEIDEIQDGARAQIVEELIIKSIHSEITADLDASLLHASSQVSNGAEIVPFGFLSHLSRLAEGLEVASSQLWEWEDAIVEGSRLFLQLRANGAGTVQLDLDARTITYANDVYVDLPGAIVGVGSAVAATGDCDAKGRDDALAQAVLAALGLNPVDLYHRDAVDVRQLAGGGLAVRGQGAVQEAIWMRRAVSFRVTWMDLASQTACTVLALADARSPALP
jgi:NTP pyrophosphatase (non-canonical NTP hydrolase)